MTPEMKPNRWFAIEQLVTQGKLTPAEAGELYDEAVRLHRDNGRLRAAFKEILAWDCLSPTPLADLCADLPWLKRLVEDALKGS